MKSEPNYIKANIPPTEEDYQIGNGEGCFFIVDDRAKAAYDTDEAGTMYEGILANDSLYYPGLNCGEKLPLEMRGSKRPVVPLEALKKWKARPVNEVLTEYAKYQAAQAEGNRV